MSLSPKHPLALAVVVGGFLLQTNVHAQDDDAGIIVGTYQPQQVAQATNFQQEVMQQMQGLQQRAQQAQQQQDQVALQQIQREAEQIQQNATNQFLADVEAVMPEVSESTGADVIARAVTYTAEGITTRDVTQAIIDAMGGGSETMSEGAMSEGGR